MLARYSILRPWSFLLLGLAVSGCGRREFAPVDAADAQVSLVAALDAWKEGKNPADLRQLDPSIMVGDMDWEAGKRLKDYSLEGEPKEYGPNLHRQVKLTLADAAGGVEIQQVTYIVGTDPVLTVFREEGGNQ